MLPTPPSTHSSRSSSPTPAPAPHAESAATDNNASKKKKKKKSKKGAKAKEPSAGKVHGTESSDDRPPVLCISRNKHWRYISSYHGPWLQLPLELLESLLLLNLDPTTLSAADQKLPPLPSLPSPTHPPRSNASQKQRDRGFSGLGDYSPPGSPCTQFASLAPPPLLPPPCPGKATPPPIDPGVFRSVTHIRRLIDEASELSVRASSGMSAAALGSLHGGGGGMGGGAWGAGAPSYGLGSLGDAGGRNVAMSAMRVHRLRALAVQKLAAAYKADEIASSVMVMQGGSVFDDIAERVLRTDPTDVDARYVHFFHEKIPSRQLAESTSTHVLDELIAANPTRLEFHRTRGIVHCFRDEYGSAVKDFTHAIREARSIRKARTAHMNSNLGDKQRAKGSKKKKKGKADGSKTNGQVSPNGTSASAGVLEGISVEGPDGEPILLHPSVLPDAPEPIEPQCLFLRAAAYLQHAVFLIEEAILKLENIRKAPSIDGAEMRLCYIENGKYGGVEISNPDGPLGRRDGPKLTAYRTALTEPSFREQITSLVKKSMRDHRQFLTHFDTLEGALGYTDRDIVQRIEYAFLLSEFLRPGSQSTPPPVPNAPPMFTTYHPLLVESHFSILIGYLLLSDFPALLTAFSRTAALVDGLEGYPVFLPPRSMSQAEFIEILERLAGGWRNGIQPHSRARARARGNTLAIEGPAPPSPLSSQSPSTSQLAPRMPTPPTPDETGWDAEGRPGPSFSTHSLAASLGVNGSSSSSKVPRPSSSSRRDPSPEEKGARRTPPSPGAQDLAGVLDAARVLLAPVAKRQREKAEQAERERAGAKSKSKKPLNINIPLHGPRVEIVLAWMAAGSLYELDGGAQA
ncbi:uncharacterized protein BXZ73DRAFT_54801 [Epithele typhae]|uniref:uncharacterized protein n=1 Tax=Epithele typhae TaxID=378194 RepID=UPI002008385F|nr:uncharacterized protein BXZ73DRAFT_54801 [Epithele typhae]KAH9914619.1 hypothetical protein BXZ73DRAFT_54801 [Epithele typhae]